MMQVLARGEWREGYLDYHRADGECRVRVLAWRALERVDGLYFVRPKSIRLVYNYLREIGGREVLRKLASRREERLRNDKFVSCGFGLIMEGGDDASLATGQHVVFIAPSHPECVDRVVLPTALLLRAEEGMIPELEPGSILYSSDPVPATTSRWWRCMAGWSACSGDSLPREKAAVALHEALGLLSGTNWRGARRLPVVPARATRERTEAAAPRGGQARKSAVLVGYGNYAKTVILPNVRHHLDVSCVHEIDPTQIGETARRRWCWDTAPSPRADRNYDAWLIAGYHHTHAPLAVSALRRGSYAVVEKPLATDEDQLEALTSAIRQSPRFFAGFHKRYTPMNDWARADLRLGSGEAVSYHCIVYEVPLPARHWYRWPSSRSRIVSNGCHWIDHFLFLNRYSAVEAFDVQQAPDGTTSCFAVLNNGACFTMVLTDQGAPRIGVQEHIELRANGATVRVVDGSYYRSENPHRILRRARIHKYSGFARMYRSIGRAIQRGEPGDSIESVITSTKLVLAFERRLQSLHS